MTPVPQRNQMRSRTSPGTFGVPFARFGSTYPGDSAGRAAARRGGAAAGSCGTAVAAVRARGGPAGRPLPLASVDESCLAAASPAENNGWSEALRAAMAQLPPDQREALGLRVLQGFTYADVAAALECSETHARRRVLDALGRVRGMME